MQLWQLCEATWRRALNSFARLPMQSRRWTRIPRASQAAILHALLFAFVVLAAVRPACAVITVGAMGDSYSDETMPAFGIPTWNEILVAGGRANFGPFANFPSGDPRNTGGFGSYTYNFAKGGATTTSALGSTQTFPVVIHNWHSQPGSPDQTDLWPGIRGAGISEAIQFASQEIGGNDILSRISAGKLLAGLDIVEMNAILGRFEQILNIATVNYSSPLKMVLVTYPDLGSMPLFAALPEASKLSIRANMDYFNNSVRGWAAVKGMGVVELWNLWETAKATPYTIHGIPIDPFALGSGAAQDLDTIFLSDGLHPTPIFQALWANEFIKAVNTTYGQSIPLLSEKEMVTLSLLDPQRAPTASAGGVYAIDAHAGLLLDGSGSTDANVGDVPFLQYSWDLNGDGVFGDAAGVQPTLAWSELSALGIGLGTYVVKVRVDDTFGGITVSAATSLTVTPLPGDVNLDADVNIFDVNLVSAHWGESGPLGDANGDGAVDIFDVNLISANWTTAGGAAASVPEPSALLLSCIAVIAMLCLGRRTGLASVSGGTP